MKVRAEKNRKTSETWTENFYFFFYMSKNFK
jgi:hypothetical protein